jgi:hypothetical protein
MMPKSPPVLPSRRRWILAYPFFNLAILIGLGRAPLPWVEIGVVSLFCVLYVISEFVLMPRMSLPASRWCSCCDARSPEKSHACVGCGREFSGRTPALYPIDLSLLPATKKAGRWAIAIVIAMTIPVFGAWFFFSPTGGQTIIMTVYFFMAFYGYEFAKWLFVKRIVRQLCQYSGAICTNCAYPIDGSMTVCPECGARETAAHARRDWLTTGVWLPRERGTPALAATSLSSNPEPFQMPSAR